MLSQRAACSLSGSVIQLDNIFRKLVINFSVKFGFPENVIQPDNTLVWSDMVTTAAATATVKLTGRLNS